MPPTSPSAEGAAQGPWQRFCRRYLFDYAPAASRLWLAIGVAGGASLLHALWQLADLALADLWPVLAGLGAVALAALFATQIPRTKYSVSAADVFTFALLAALGPPAAVLAAGLDGLIGTWRTSKRLSSRVSTPAAAMFAMSVCALVFGLLVQGLQRAGLSPGVAALAGLVLAAPVPFVLTTMPLMTMLALKRGAPVQPAQWIADSAWMAAIYLAAAFVAGLVHLNAQTFGREVLAIGAVLALVLVMLLRVTLQRGEAEHRAQEAKIAAARREAELNQLRFMASFTHAAIGMAIVRPDGNIHQVNQALCELLGGAESQLLGQPFIQVLHGADIELFNRHRQGLTLAAAPASSLELRCLHSDGTEVWVSMHCSPFVDPAQDRTGMIYQLHDITSRRMAEGKLHHIAYHDGLTDLANRNCFHERLRVVVERSRLDPGVLFAILFLDLDRFKIVNDSLGHSAGNELLREVAQRLRSCVRPNDLVARLGGDEFAVLLDQLHDPQDGQRLAQRVLETLTEPMFINGTEVQPGASVGMTFSDLGYRTADEMLRDADLAMYEAKAAGRGRVALFDSSMLDRVAQKLALESDLRHAIGEGTLTMQFQPIFELEPYRLSGFEALVRWVHPTRGPVSPAVFVALAEESGNIEALTDWVIEQGVAQLAEWRRGAPHLDRLTMNVNISGRDLVRVDLLARVREVLQRNHVPPARLTLEITETTLMGRLDLALQTMSQLRELGVRFSIDDFGTGYSSLAYLSTLPIDSLKIDRSFVIGLHDRPQNVEIVRAVMTLGRSLGRKVIAEGIETAEQLAALRGLGVCFGQGYLLSRPLSAEHVLPLLYVNSLQPAPAERTPLTEMPG